MLSLVKNIRKNNKGFTMMEMIIVVAIIAILMTVSAFGISAYVDSAEKYERDNVAEVAYMALQNYLTDLKREGKLGSFNNQVNNYAGHVEVLTCTDQLRTVLSSYYADDDFTGHYEDYVENHEGSHIVAVSFSAADKNNPFYNVLFDCIGNEDELEKAYIIEYNQTTGVVMSVFYSKTIDSFDLASMYDSSNLNSTGNIVLRDSASLDEKKQGYYGVINTALRGIEIPPVEEEKDRNPVFVNSDRVYLTFTDDTALTRENGDNVQYKVSLIVSNAGGERVNLDPIIYDYSSMKNSVYAKNQVSSALDMVDSPTLVTPDNERAIRLKRDDDEKFFFVLDCDHLYSLHSGLRYELEHNEAVKALGPIEKLSISATMQICVNTVPTATITFDESINPVFADYDSIYDVYTLSCTRHLNNIRDFANDRKYLLTDNINLLQYEREEFIENMEKDEETGLSYLNMTDDESLALTASLGDASNRHCFANFERIKCYIENTTAYETKEFVITYLYDSDNVYRYSSEAYTREPGGSYYTTTSHELLEQADNNGGDKDVKAVVFNGMLIGLRNPDGAFMQNVKNASSANSDAYANIDHVLAGASKGACYTITGINNNNSGNKANFIGIFPCLGERGVVGGIGFKNSNTEGYFNVGLVCGVNDGHLNGVFVDDVTVKGTAYLGSIAGRTEVSVSNVHVSGRMNVEAVRGTKDTYHFITLGGLFGSVMYDTLYTSLKTRNPGDIVISNCTIDCPEYGRVYTTWTKGIGGLAGECYGNIVNCSINMTLVRGLSDTGGLVGKMFLGTIDGCSVSIKELSAQNNNYIGGYVGSCGDFSLRTGRIEHRNGAPENYSSVVIKNSIVTDATQIKISGGSTNYCGGFAGMANDAIIDNCEFAGDIIFASGASGLSRIGGIVGGSYLDLTITNTRYTGDIRVEQSGTVGATAIGGMVGHFSYKENDTANRRDVSEVRKLVIDNCEFAGDFFPESGQAKSINQCGLMVGYVDDNLSGGYDVTITNCKEYEGYDIANIPTAMWATGNVSNSGGMVGYIKANQSTSWLKIQSCSVNANIRSKAALSSVGDIVGYSDVYNLEVTDCAASGAITSGSTMTNVGGIVGNINSGSNIKITNATNSVVITSTTTMTSASGIVGNINSGSNIKITNATNSATITAETTMTNVGGIVGNINSGSNIKITNATNSATITAETTMTSASGIVGNIKNGSDIFIEECTNSGSLVSETSYITKTGGIVGNISAGTGISLEKDTNNGCLTSETYISYSGGIVGNLIADISINEVTNSDAVTINGKTYLSRVGGIFGYVKGNVSFAKNSTNKNGGFITGGESWESGTYFEYVGGIVGFIDTNYVFNADAVILTNNGRITSETICQYVGGIVGCSKGYSILTGNVANNGEIKVLSGTMQTTGGIVGGGACKLSNTTLSNAPITSVAGMDRVGGYIGEAKKYDSSSYVIELHNVTNTITITNTTSGSMTKVGGLIGEILSTTSFNKGAYNSGNIVAEGATVMDRVGGLVGSSKNPFAMTVNGNENGNYGNFKHDVFQNNGNITSQNTIRYTGGILGYYEGSAKFELTTGAYNYGKITASVKLGNMTDNGAFDGSVGGIIGYTNGTVSIANAENHGELHSGEEAYYVGGIIGYTKGSVSIANVENHGELHSDKKTYYVGGIIGYTNRSVSIANAENCGEIHSGEKAYYVGGIIGYTKSGSIGDEVYNKANITIRAKTKNDTKYVGGIVGCVAGQLSITKTTNEGEIHSDTILNWTGGIIGGTADNTNAKVTFGNNVCNKAALSSGVGTDRVADLTLNCVGGILGYAGTKSTISITGQNISNTGNISSTGKCKSIGGLIGYAQNDGGAIKITGQNIFNTGNITSIGAVGNVGGLVGNTFKTTTISSWNNVYNKGTISASAMVPVNDGGGTSAGGIVGRSENTLVIGGNVYNSGEIKTTEGAVYNVGGIVGYTTSTCTIKEEVHNDGDITAGTTMTAVGGVVGYTTSTCTINGKVHNEGKIIAGTTMTSVGGLVGKKEGTGKLTINGDGNYNSVDLIAPGKLSNVGGIVGHITAGDCEIAGGVYNKGNIESTKNELGFVGGLVGYVEAAGKLSIIGYSNYNEGTITGYKKLSNVGGLVGYTKGTTSILVNGTAYNKGAIASKEANVEYTGGLVGQSDSTLSIGGSVYNSGSITAKTTMSNAGGIVGYTIGACTISNEVHNEGNIATGTSMVAVGGLVGYTNSDCTINDAVYNKGAITPGTTMTEIGGLVGKKEGTGKLTISGYGIYNSADLIISGTLTNVGGLVGHIIDGSCEISGSSVCNTGKIESTAGELKQVGGFIGYAERATTSIVINTGNGTNSGALTAYSNMTDVGGLVGWTKGDLQISAAHNTGMLSATTGLMTRVGGLVGKAEGGKTLTLSGCNNTGKMYANTTLTYVGGIVGFTNDVCSITDGVNNSGSLSSNGNFENVGGLIGGAEALSDGSGSVIINGSGVINTGDLFTKANIQKAGGLIGRSTASVTIGNAANEGNIYSSEANITNAGGLIGWVDNNITINGSGPSSCYNRGSITAATAMGADTNNFAVVQSSVGGIIGCVKSHEARLSNVSNQGVLLAKKSMWFVGGIIGCTNGDTIITGNVKNSGNIISGENNTDASTLSMKFVGGLIGLQNSPDGKTVTINGSGNGNSAAITSNTSICAVGGLIGLSKGYAIIRDYPSCSGMISAASGYMQYVGGVIGKGMCDIDGISNSVSFVVNNNKFISVGGIIGWCNNDTGNATLVAKISNATNTGSFTSSGNIESQKIGGIVGACDADEIILTNVTNTGAININDGSLISSGGIIGTSKKATIVNAINSGSIFANTGIGGSNANQPSWGVGGILGYANIYTEIINSRNSGNISSRGNMYHVGGVVGAADKGILIYSDIDRGSLYYDNRYDTNSGSIMALSSNKTVTYIGGLVGRTRGGLAEIENCANSGRISSATHVTFVGGLIGKAETGAVVNLSYNKGNIEINGVANQVGGLIGELQTNVATEITNNYCMSDIRYNSNNNLGGLFGKINVAVTPDVGICYNYFGGNIFANYTPGGGYIVGGVSSNPIEFIYCYAYNNTLQVGANGYYGSKGGAHDFVSYTEEPHNNFILDAAEYDKVVYILGGNKPREYALVDIQYLISLTSGMSEPPMLMMMPFGLFDDESVSENSISENSISENSVSGNSVSDNSVSDNDAPEGSVSDNSVSDNSVSDNEATPSPSASASPTASPSASATPSATPSPGATPTVTPSATPSASASPGITPSASPSVTPTAEPTPAVTPAPEPEVTPTPSVTPTATPTPEITPSATPTPSPEPTPEATPAPEPVTEPEEDPEDLGEAA